MEINFPEVHSDERRDIFANDTLLEGKEISIISLNKGKAIGGCIHSTDEIMFILKGCVLCNFGDGWESHNEGFGCLIPSGTPHAFMAPMFPCLILEAGLTEQQKKESGKDHCLEREVERINGKD